MSCEFEGLHMACARPSFTAGLTLVPLRAQVPPHRTAACQYPAGSAQRFTLALGSP